MGRKILAAVIGLIVAIAIIMLIEMLNSLQITPPEPDVLADRAKLREYMANGPTLAYVVVLIGYVLASFLAGFICFKVEKKLNRINSKIFDFVGAGSGFICKLLLAYGLKSSIQHDAPSFVIVFFLFIIPLLTVTYIIAIYDAYRGNASKPESMITPFVIGIVLTVGALVNLYLLPGQPLWFAVLCLLCFIPLSLLGHRFAR